MNERQLFESAVEIADPQARQAFLDGACQGDPHLRAKVESLLKSHAEAGSFLDIPAADQMGPKLDNVTTNTFVGARADDQEDADESQPDLSFLQPSSKPGSIGVLAHYEVLSVLGQGAFGIVFKAFDEKLHRLVAIKIMNPQMASTSPPRKRFLREARSAAAIKHENVVQVYSVEEQPLPYLVMEFIDGQTLKQKLDETGPLETREVLHIARQIASGLAAAQAMGLIHRDIKPANILLESGAEQRVKISDFGLARAADDASMTRTGVISGTPMYMAPEQAAGQALDHRADLFSLGSVLYQMACGRPPFRAATTVAVLHRVVEDTPRPLQEILPEIPDWLVAIVTKLHAKKPEDRFQTAKEVAELLGRCQSELQLNGHVTCVAAASTSAPPASVISVGNTSNVNIPATPVDTVGDNWKNVSPDRSRFRKYFVPLVMVFIALPIATGVVTPPQPVTGFLMIIALLAFACMTFWRRRHSYGLNQELPTKVDPRQPHTSWALRTVFVMVPLLVMFPILFGRHLSPAFNAWLWPPIPTLPVTEIKTGLRFDGKDDYVKVGPIDLSSPQYTLEAFVTSAKDGDNGVIALLKNVEKEPELMYLYDGYPGGQRQSGAAIIGQRPYQNVSAPLSSGTRQHRALVVDGSAMHYYVNGVWQGKRYCTARKGLMWQMRELYVGCKSIQTEFFRGQIDQLRLSKIARYSNNFPVESKLTSDDSTLVLYNFDEGHGEVLNDASGHGHHGMIVGATWVSLNASSRSLSPVESTDTTAPNRRAAEWVLSLGGYIDCQLSGSRQPRVKDVGMLPKEPFELLNVYLEYTKVTDADLERLKDLKLIQAVNLIGTQISDKGLQHLANLRSLINLPLGETKVTDAGIESLRNLTQLRHLNLTHNRDITDRSLTVVGRFAQLESLVLDGTLVTDNGLIELSKLNKLTELNLNGCKGITDAGMNALRPLHNLTGVSLASTPIGDNGLETLSRLPKLVTLSMEATSVTDFGLRHLAECPKLKSLRIDATKISDAGLKYLQKLQSLQELMIGNRNLTDVGVAHLSSLPQLKHLNLHHSPLVTASGVTKLSTALPGCKIEWDGGVIEPKTGWHGWPTDAPPPAIAPFDAEQAKQHQAAWAKYLSVPVEYTNSLGMKFRLIPPGEFLMGGTLAEIQNALTAVTDPLHKERIISEGPQHKVVLTQPIYLGVHEVTQSQYLQIMGVNPSRISPTSRESDADSFKDLVTTDYPVEMVSWTDAAEFCAKLCLTERMTPSYARVGETVTMLEGLGYRLPTEAEWEFACRAGTTTKFWTGDNLEGLEQSAWFTKNARLRTHAVGKLKANPFSLYDVHGNVAEWVQDRWSPEAYNEFSDKPATNPTTGDALENSTTQYVMRGGEWSFDISAFGRSSARFSRPAHFRYHSGEGFRVALPVDAVRQVSKIDGPKIAKPGVPIGANGNPVAEQGRSAWDDLDPAQIPEAERVPFQPKELVAVLGEHRQRHWDQISSVAIRPDGKQAATCAGDGIRFWDLQTFQEQAHLSVLNTPGLPPGATISVLYTPDGRSLLVGHGLAGPDNLLISEINVTVFPPKLARSWKLPNNWYANTYLSEVSPSGRFLSGWGYGTDNKCFLVERTETELKPVADLPDGWRISFAPDEKSIALATRDGGKVRLLDFQNNKLTEKAVLTGSAAETADQPMSPLRDAKFSPDGRLVVIDAKFVPWFWNVSGVEPKPLSKLALTAALPSFSKDGSTLIARDNNDGGFNIWSIDNQKAELRGSSTLRLPRNWTALPSSNIQGFDVSPDGKLAVLGHLNGSVKFIDISSSDLAELHPVKPNPFIGLRYARPLRMGDDSFTVMSEELPYALTWHLENARLQRIGALEAGYGRLLAAASDGSVIVNWETPPTRCVVRRRDQNEWRPIRNVSTTLDVVSGALSRDQRRLVIGSNSGEIELWDLEAKPARKLWSHRTPQNRAVLRLHYAMRESLLVSEVYESAVVQRITDTGLEPVFTGPIMGNLAMDVAPDGESMALVADNSASTWSISSDPPQLVQQLSASQVSNPHSVAYAPDGRQLAVAYANGQIWLHDPETGTVSRKLQLPGVVRHTLFTTDNRHLNTANGNGTIYVLRLEAVPAMSPK